MSHKKATQHGHLLWQLFISTFMLCACTFGGGFVIVSLMKKKFVEELGWIEESEMLDITAIAQSSPGPIPINASVILGYRMRGIIGSIVAVLGTSIPPLVIISIIAVFYDAFRHNAVIATALLVMRAGVAAVICDVVINLAKNIICTGNRFYMVLMVITFVMTYFMGISAMTIILLCIAIGLITLLLEMKRNKQQGDC